MSTLSQFVGGTPIKSVQRGTINPGFGASSGTVSISTVNTSKAAANFTGYVSSSSSPDFARITLTGSTSLFWATKDNTSTRTISWEVIEFV